MEATTVRNILRRHGFKPHQVKTSHDGRIGNGERVAVDGLARISRGRLRLSRPLAIPGSFPMRGLRQRGFRMAGRTDFPPGSQQRIRLEARSARHPVRLGSSF